MKKFIELLKWFCYITPGILFVCAANELLADETVLPAKMLWDILLSSFLTALVTTFLVPREGTKKKILFDTLLHYTALSIVMIGCGCLFGWIDFNFLDVLSMLISVAAVYLTTIVIYYLIDLRQADEINQKLKEKYGDKR